MNSTPFWWIEIFLRGISRDRLWPISRIHVQPARTVSQPFIFGAATAWIVITFEKAVRVSRARRPASDRKGGHLRRLAWPNCNGKFPRHGTVRCFSTKFPKEKAGGRDTDKCRILCFLSFRYIPPEDAEERLKLLALSSTLRIMAYFVSHIVRCVNVRKSWSFETSDQAKAILYIMTRII